MDQGAATPRLELLGKKNARRQDLTTKKKEKKIEQTLWVGSFENLSLGICAWLFNTKARSRTQGRVQNKGLEFQEKL